MNHHDQSPVGRAQDVPDIPPNTLNLSGNAALLPDLPGNWPMRYRRSTTPGATYFFTVVTYRRRAILCEPDTMALLREAFATAKQRHSFRIDAVVILPDHLHCLWTLPLGDADYSSRWMLIKSHFTRRCAASLKTTRSPALRHKREQTIWQHRVAARVPGRFLIGSGVIQEGLCKLSLYTA